MAGDVARMDLAAYFRSVRHHAWRLSRPERQGLVASFSQALMGKTCLRRNFVGAGLSFPGSSEDNRFDHVRPPSFAVQEEVGKGRVGERVPGLLRVVVILY